MNYSFYSATAAAQSQQRKFDVIANNLSNANTTGFKTKYVTFTDLMYQNMNAPEEEQTNLLRGAGSKLMKADTDYVQGVIIPTDGKFDFAIDGDGFFALFDPLNQQTSYTRNGHFELSQQQNGEMYLVAESGKWVLDKQGNPIVVENYEDDVEVGIYIFDQKNGMFNLGHGEFLPQEKNGQARLAENDDHLIKGFLECSNVETEREMIYLLESQRAYQFAIKMIQTTDEIESNINSLRQ